MLTSPADCDSLIFQFLYLEDLLSARICSRASLRRYDPRKSKPVWRSVCPTLRSLKPYLGGASLKLLEFLANTYALTPEQAQQARLLQYACRRVVAAAARGVSELETIKRLANTYNFEEGDARSSDSFVLRHACWGGHLELLQWLVEYFKVAVVEIRSCRAFRITCEYGYIDTAKWLVDRFELDIPDVRAVDHAALRSACRNGHLGVVQWLASRFKLTAIDAIDALGALDSQARVGPAAKWLRRVFSL